MKTITAISWNEDRIYHRIEIPWPEGDERKPSPKPKDLGMLELEVTVPTSDQAVTQGQSELVDAAILGIAA